MRRLSPDAERQQLRSRSASGLLCLSLPSGASVSWSSAWLFTDSAQKFQSFLNRLDGNVPGEVGFYLSPCYLSVSCDVAPTLLPRLPG
jgi:hypothetical protein